jgi:hypothetical protein
MATHAILRGMAGRLRQTLGPARYQHLRRELRRLARPAWVRLLRRTTPVSEEWGLDRGTPIDRYYIDRFLSGHRGDIRGRVLEIRDSRYTDRFGHHVDRSDVLDIDAMNPRATIIADLSRADAVRSDQFDCFVLTQTLQFIYDSHAAITHAARVLRPGGVVLVTVPAVSRIAPRYGLATDYWRFTIASCARLFGDVFGKQAVDVASYGNVLTAIAFLAGLSAEEVAPYQLDACDDHFPVIITVRAVKPSNGWT